MMKFVKVYHDLISVVDELSDAEAGRLLKAMLVYGSAGEVRALSGQEKLVFAMIRAQMDRDRESYDKKSQQNRENGSKGGRPKKPTGFSNNPEKATGFSNNPEKPRKSQDKDKDKDIIPLTPLPGDDDDDDSFFLTQQMHNEVFDAAVRAGFKDCQATFDALVGLISESSCENVLKGIHECVEHNASSLAYLRKVLAGKPKAESDDQFNGLQFL